MNKPKVTLLKDSLHPQGYRFQTFLLSFPKCLLAELNTHRSLVRNVGSSRAIPTKKLIEKVETNPYVPEFTENKKGMSGNPVTDSSVISEAKAFWDVAIQDAIFIAIQLNELNIHKQDVNRLLEPFTYINVLVSGTDFEHLYDLRISENAQPAFYDIASQMKKLSDNNKPDVLAYGDWHIPFSDYMYNGLSIKDKIKVATARCARISYENHEGNFEVEKDYKLHDSLITNKHLTPLEHICKAVKVNDSFDLYLAKPSTNGDFSEFQYHMPKQLVGNFSVLNNTRTLVWTRQYKGFYTYRHMLEDDTYEF